MTENQKYQTEKRELGLLLDQGVDFTVEYTRRGLFKKSIKASRTFHIPEPTLSTLDRISLEQIELKVDEEALSSGDALAEARTLVRDQAKRCARIIAIAILGHGANVWELRRLTKFFYNHLKPSKLIHLVRIINTMGNLGDFCNSIRLMSAVRTTMPTRIEEGAEV